MKTRITDLLNIKYPILQGGMAWISRPSLVAAVTNSGGAGTLVTNWGVEQLRKDIHEIRERTDGTFGVNVNFGIRQAEWRDEMIQCIIEEKVPFIVMGAGDQRPFIPKFMEGGVLTACIVPKTRLAKRIEAAGADILIIEGYESGGRIGTLSTLSLMTNVIPEVSVPIIAAGGFADGRGLAAALIMGADGIQIGTRFLLADECIDYHPSNVQAILEATDEDCVSIGLSRNKGLRGLRSAFSAYYTELETSGVPTDELNKLASNISKKVAENGIGNDGMNGFVQAGQSVGPLNRVQPAAEIISEIVSDAEKLLLNANTLVQ